MKYTIKGQKVIKEDFSIEVEADSYVDAFRKVTSSLGHNIEVERINDKFITNQVEADWQDHDVFSGAIKSVSQHYAFDLELIKELFRKNKAVKYFSVYFSGQGDDGCIDNVCCEPYSLNNVVSERVGSVTVSELLSKIADNFLNDIPIDWVNGDGGGGQIDFRLDGDHIKMEVSCYDREMVECNQFNQTVIL